MGIIIFYTKTINSEWYVDDVTQRVKDLINTYRAKNLKVRRQIEELYTLA